MILLGNEKSDGGGGGGGRWLLCLELDIVLIWEIEKVWFCVKI